MKKAKKFIAFAAAMSACLCAGTGTYAAVPVSALSIIWSMTDATVEKDTISIGESIPINIEWSEDRAGYASYLTSDETVATVDAAGIITGVGEGSATITVIASNGMETPTRTVNITVTAPEAGNDFTYEIQNGSIIFKDYAPAAMMSYIVSANPDYSMVCGEDEATFTPSENGRYVLTVEALHEAIIDAGNGHFHYFYPILTNYIVDVSESGIAVEKKGERNYYSEEQITSFQKSAEESGEFTACCDLMAKEDTLDSWYMAYVHGQLPCEEENSFITTVYNEYTARSYFCLFTQYVGDIITFEPIVKVSDSNKALVMAESSASSYVDGNLMEGTDDILSLFMVKALQDGDVTVTAEGYRKYDLTIENGIFKRSSARLSDVKGDANGDGEMSLSDAVTVQRWLLGASAVSEGWENADLYQNGRIDVLDLVLLKRELLKEEQTDTRPILTREEAVAIFEKNDSPTWSDFAQYRSQDIGSGIFILKYEIEIEDDANLFLYLYGPYLNEDPERIEIETAYTRRIDITDPLFDFLLANGLRFPKPPLMD